MYGITVTFSLSQDKHFRNDPQKQDISMSKIYTFRPSVHPPIRALSTYTQIIRFFFYILRFLCLGITNYISVPLGRNYAPASPHKKISGTTATGRTFYECEPAENNKNVIHRFLSCAYKIYVVLTVLTSTVLVFFLFLLKCNIFFFYLVDLYLILYSSVRMKSV